MNEKRYISSIEGWAADKSIPKNIVNLLCRYAQNDQHQHIPQCFETINSIEEKEAFERLTSIDNMALTDSLYLVKVVEPLLETLPSHNDAEPSFLYSLLQRLVRESTDAKEKEVEETNRVIAEKEQIVQELAKEMGISGLTTVTAVDTAIQKIKAIEEALIKQPKDLINDIQTQISRIVELPRLKEVNKKVSAAEFRTLIQSYVSRLNDDLKSSETMKLKMNERVEVADGKLAIQKAKNQKAHEVYDNLSPLLRAVSVAYDQHSSSSRKEKASRFAFFKSKTEISVPKSNNKKNFLLKGKKGLCDNMISLLDQYIYSPGHSADRMASAKKIFAKARALKVDDSLSLLEKDRILLDLIRAEKIASKGRWNGKTSKLFAIYREAEFYYREQLYIETDKVLPGQLASKDEMAQKIVMLKGALEDLQSQNVLMAGFNVKLNQLREDELLLVMNAEKAPLTEKQLLVNSRIQNKLTAKLAKLNANEKELVRAQSDLLKKEIEAEKLRLDSDTVIADIKAIYNETRKLSIKLVSQGKVSLAILPESDTLAVSEMATKATAYLAALKASAEEEKSLVFEAGHETVSASVATASF